MISDAGGSWLITFAWTPDRKLDQDRLELLHYRLQRNAGTLHPQDDGTCHVNVTIRAQSCDAAIPLALTVVADATGATRGDLIVVAATD
jgi:hypothetical protein